jgi:hypothetical protein
MFETYMPLKFLFPTLLLLLPISGFGQNRQFLGLGILPSYAHLSSSQFWGRQPNRWSNNYPITYRTQLSAHWYLQASLLGLAVSTRSDKYAVQWPSEFDPVTGGYRPDPSLPKFTRFSEVHFYLAAPLELLYFPGKRQIWGVSFGFLPNTPLIRRVGSVFYFSDGGEQCNLSSQPLPFRPRLGAVIGMPVSLPIAKYWKLELQPKIITYQFGDTLNSQVAFQTGGSVQLFRQLGQRPFGFRKKKKPLLNNLDS